MAFSKEQRVVLETLLWADNLTVKKIAAKAERTLGGAMNAEERRAVVRKVLTDLESQELVTMWARPEGALFSIRVGKSDELRAALR